jgi:hypothetical protein
MVPIYLPPVVVPHEVLEEEKAIIRAEGWFHVAGQYYRSAPDADKMRRLEAEKRIRDRDRRCAWCAKPIDAAAAVEAAGEKIHADPCAKEFESFTSPAPIIPLEQQLRKSIELGRIQDNDLVAWGQWVDEDTPNERYEYEQVKWSELSVYERHTVERQPDGRLVGGYPF